MNEKKGIVKVTALAGLVATVGITGPADAAIHNVQAKIEQLRNASRQELRGSILTSVAERADRQTLKYTQSYNQSYTQSYTETHPPAEEQAE